MTAPTSKFPELGFYGLPGHTRTPADVLQQVQDAEALGIGNVMISERPDYKEISAICGACEAAESTNSLFESSARTVRFQPPCPGASLRQACAATSSASRLDYSLMSSP